MNALVMKILKYIAIITLAIITFITFGHEHYKNPYKYGDPDFFDFIKWKTTRIRPAWPELPIEKPTAASTTFISQARNLDITATYINHATVLLQIGGKNILTDPIWSSHAGPFGKIGVPRSIYPGIDIDKLPPIDVILISHSHYDHLDLPSLKILTNIHKPKLIMGLGVARYIEYCQENTTNCTELNWWDNKELDGVKYNFVPAYHWSSRYILDKNTSLWGGFIITHSEKNVYFPGDTAFGDGEIFKEMRRRYGKINLSLLPIGAYKPSWFFSQMHLSPESAVRIFKILDGDYAVPMHFDTFELTDEEYPEPLHDLKTALKNENISEDKFIILPPGGSYKLL